MIFICSLICGESFAQSGEKAQEKLSPKEAAPEIVEEEIKTIWGLTSYLGKKLAGEMGNRMNLDESEEQPRNRVRKVKINLGPFKIERTERI
jgi:hypothetical protein